MKTKIQYQTSSAIYLFSIIMMIIVSCSNSKTSDVEQTTKDCSKADTTALLIDDDIDLMFINHVINN